MFSIANSMKRPLAAASFLCALLAFAPSANSAVLTVEDLIISYSTHTATTATGSIQFNLRFASLSGDPGGYDSFSSQLIVSKGGSNGAFALDEAYGENTSAAGGSYWLPTAPTNNQNASTQSGQFRFRDFVGTSFAYTPTPGKILARYKIDFNVTSAAQFGTYDIAEGNQNNNYFKSDIVNTYLNKICGVKFKLVPLPEPTTGMMVLIGGVVAMRRRQRRS